ncbi:MAG TPA: hypothetical protein DHV14_11795 [Micrococcales bacterium]|uniref:hypothetical protein n=1 Tax=Miniimonas arenae TaxID=676201 RepID=UPI000ECEC1AC|nr:hypothetical protein [Miniimonas arenae]HCX85795.1 hypothetical protein [Micrococcales bacterium]
MTTEPENTEPENTEPENTEPEDADTADDDTLEHDRGLPLHRSQEHPEDIPAFLDRALARARDLLPEVEDFTVDGVAFETAAGVWLAPIGVFDPTADVSPSPEQVAAGETDVAVWGHRMSDWANRAQHAMRASWGAPVVHTPRRVGAAQEPEGILDYLLLAQDFAQAEVWDRHEVFVALLSEWTGEPGTSTLRQIAMLLPRPLMMTGMAAYLTDETVQELLMHGESPVELHRRAWVLSTLFDRGEVHVRDVAIEATRCTLRSRTGTTSTWIFADDGRQLLLVHDPASEFLTLLRRLDDEHVDGDDGLPASDVPNDDPNGDPEGDPDAWTASQLIRLERLLDGVPEDLRACVDARGETVTGDVAEHALAFGLLDGRPIPIASGAFWFDGSVWRASPGLVQAGFQNDLTLDDFGLEDAVRIPFRLGGVFTPATFTSEDEPEPVVLEVFDACPYPEQPRPEGDTVLGYGVPRPYDHEAVVEAIERACAAWWERDPEQGTLGEDPFVVVGRRLRDAGGPDTLQTVLARGEYWTVEALSAWNADLRRAMTARWGEPTETVYDPDQLGLDHHTPLTAVMRGIGLTKGWLWWVDGHAVVTLAGFPRTEHRSTPVVTLVICRADAVVELLGRMTIWELRWRARVIENLAALAHGDPAVPPHLALDRVATEVAWPASAPATPLEGSRIQPTVRRIRIRAEDIVWTLHLTHDRRAVLTSRRPGASPTEAADLLEGLPSDLRPLVVASDGEASDGEASSIAGAPLSAVFYRDGGHWRATDNMLAEARAAGREGRDPLEALYSAEAGVPQLRRVLGRGQQMSPRTLSEAGYAERTFGVEVTPDQALAALEHVSAPLTQALTGTLHDLLDAIVQFDSPHRYLLDAALDTLDPQDRREKSLWLLANGATPTTQLAARTPVNVLLGNPTLDGGDAVVLRRLIATGADTGPGLLGSRGTDPFAQLTRRNLAEDELRPLLEALGRRAGTPHRRGTGRGLAGLRRLGERWRARRTG